MTMAVTGLKPGIAANKNRPATDSAVITAMITIYRLLAFFFSKVSKKGIIVRMTITVTIKRYLRSSKTVTPTQMVTGTNNNRMIYVIHCFLIIPAPDAVDMLP